MSSGRYDDLRGIRTDALFGLFNNWHRAVIVETNDPLNMGRVRFKCPEMHDEDLADDDCPWALPTPSLGGLKSGEWRSPVIDDIIFIAFEKGHPYGPVWTAAADPTRRESYTLPSIHISTPLPVDEKGDPAKQAPDDFDDEYLPKDNRPMSQGLMDRYGNLDMLGSVGYFPVGHKEPPPGPDYDAIQKKDFKQSQKPPEVNNPDSKFMIRMSKYGHIVINADQGYWWQREDPPRLTKQQEKALTDSERDKRQEQSELGEFYGDHDKDKKWEVKRWRYMRDLLHEGDPRSKDQRRLQLLTRYGHKFEMRDVGWAQKGPIKSHTRDGEYDDPRLISKEEECDYRWIKLRTKAGMLFQMYDKGADPQEDEFVKRLLKDETGVDTEEEDVYWRKKDSRFIRLITRYGFKFVMDDRGSHDQHAEEEENPRGNGVLLKGRRTAASRAKIMQEEEREGEDGEIIPPDTPDPRGFFWEFSENDTTNMTTWGTPAGATVQMSDKLQYFMVAVARRKYSQRWQKHKENEFLLEPLASRDTELKTHHLKLDHDNEYVRLKSRAGRGDKPLDGYAVSEDDGDFVNKAVRGEQQGVEFRDGEKGDGPWAELVDIDRRGIWFSRKFRLSIFRGQTSSGGQSDMALWYDESKAECVLRNNSNGYYIPPPDDAPVGTPPIYVPARIQIFCKKNIEIISDTGKINIKSKGEISIVSSSKIVMCGGDAKLELSGRNPKLSGAVIVPGLIEQNPRIKVSSSPEAASLPQVQPTDRGKRYNSELEEPAERAEIEHPIEDEE